MQRNSRINKKRNESKEISEIQNEFCNRYTSDSDVNSALRQAKGEHFAKLLAQQAAFNNLILSANGALEHETTGSALVDFNARATEFRNASDDVIISAVMRAYAEDPLSCVKLMFQTGDIRGGKGERHAFNTCMDWLVAFHPAVAEEVLALIPEYTRWDYLVRQTVSGNEEISRHATRIVTDQFHKDLKAAEGAKCSISLLAKWMPSLQAKKAEDRVIVRHLLRSLHMQEREYRKALSLLRSHLNIIEKSLSARDYDSINMENLSSKQQLRYSDCLKRVMSVRRHEYIQAVLRGEKKMNASVLNPLDILHEYENQGRWYICSYNEDLEALWSLIPDKTSGNGNTLVIRDGSGSMTYPLGQGSKATMLQAATAMAIYCSEHMTGAFHDTFITFSSKPEMVNLSGCTTLAEKINLLNDYDDCSNTDLEATFDLILDTAVSNGLSQDELPSYLMIMSDMEFDCARNSSTPRDTLFATIREKWNAAGYDMPTLVFWELNGARTIYPEIDAKNSIIFLSGFSTNELELVMAGNYEAVEEIEETVEVVDETTGQKTTVTRTRTERRVLSPLEQLMLKLSNSRYDAVEKAVLKGLARESA